MNDSADHERRFRGAPERLRAADRIARLEVPRVVALSLAGLQLENVLDVGTGTGIFAEAFAAAGLAVTGIDANTELLAQAAELVPGVEFREAPAEQMPYPDGSFDLVFLGLVLHKTDDPLAALQEARRVARRRVAILEWPYDDHLPGPPMEHRLSPATIADLAAKAGLPGTETDRLDQVDLYRFTR